MKKIKSRKLIAVLAFIVTGACSVFSMPVPVDSADSAVVRKILDSIGWGRKTVAEVTTYQGTGQEPPAVSGGRISYLNLSWKPGDVPQITFLPADIGKLPELTVLVLNNNLVTELPYQMNNLRKLTFLDISGNMLNHLDFSIAGLTNLQVLNASHNRIVKIDDANFALTSLKILNLSDNLLNGIFSASVSQASGLLSLRLDSNMLTGLSASIVELEKVVIDVRHNNICGVQKTEIEQWLASHQTGGEWKNTQDCFFLPDGVNEWAALDTQTGVWAEFSSHHNISGLGLAVQSSEINEIYGYLLGVGEVLSAEVVTSVDADEEDIPPVLIRLVFPYNGFDFSPENPSLLNIFYVDKIAGVLMPASCIIDTVNKTIETTVSQFGLYTLLYDYEDQPSTAGIRTVPSAAKISGRDNPGLDLIRKGNKMFANVSLSQETSISLHLYSVNGRLVKSLANGVYGKGLHTFDISKNSAVLSKQAYIVVLGTNTAKYAKTLIPHLEP